MTGKTTNKPVRFGWFLITAASTLRWATLTSIAAKSAADAA